MECPAAYRDRRKSRLRNRFSPPILSAIPVGERRGAMQPSIVRAGFVRAAASAIAALLVAAGCTPPAPSQPAGESGGVGAPARTTLLTNGKSALPHPKNTIVAAAGLLEP